MDTLKKSCSLVARHAFKIAGASVLGLSMAASAEVKIASAADMNANPLPHASSMLDVESTTKGVLIPRMTEAERDSVASPADGLLVYNTDRECINSYHSNTNPPWYDYCLSGQVVVDAKISGTELTEENTSAIKAIEYNHVTTNYTDPNGNDVYDPSTYTFTAPFRGLYSVKATYAQRLCGQEYFVRIGISKPNVTSPGDNASLSAVRWPAQSHTTCSIPLVAEVYDTIPLEQGDKIFIQGRYQRAIYDISGWNYDNDFLNRLLIIYVGQID